MSGAHRQEEPRDSTGADARVRVEGERRSVRGWQHLTIAEQLCGAIVFITIFAAIEAAVPSLHPWIIGPVLAGCYTFAATGYAKSTRPWRGPSFGARTRGASNIERRWPRRGPWWRVPGRRGLLVAAVGLFLVVAGFGGAASDAALLHHLRVRGVHGEAIISNVSTSRARYGQTELDSVSVQFQDRQGKAVVERLQILDTVPDSVAVGDHVAVVFDPDAPDSVLLASAMDTNHVTQDYVVGGLGIAATFLGIGWWLLAGSQRRTGSG